MLLVQNQDVQHAGRLVLELGVLGTRRGGIGILRVHVGARMGVSDLDVTNREQGEICGAKVWLGGYLVLRGILIFLAEHLFL